ncbi:uncharacterized protein LOC135200269 [Macrobrachium nipponense]|uniref:uncharacterized protein LOC135200269 n=2 Tax=Macrobrachium nipponense TaxID=159736 RepID=UPI0030C88780
MYNININSILLVLTLFISGVVSQKCYACLDQDENTGKCTTTVENCNYGEDYCLSEIKWGSTPYWEIGAPMQYYISKRCASIDECTATINKYMANCVRIWWKDWKCAECCKGDRCNYYITLGSSSVTSSIFVTAMGCVLVVALHWFN